MQGSGSASRQFVEIPGFVEQRPACPECGGNPVSHGHSWRCKDCGRQWLKETKEREAPDYTKRPNCVRCGSHRVNSSGIQWVCKDCGKYWSKKREELEGKL